MGVCMGLGASQSVPISLSGRVPQWCRMSTDWLLCGCRALSIDALPARDGWQYFVPSPAPFWPPTPTAFDTPVSRCGAGDGHLVQQPSANSYISPLFIIFIYDRTPSRLKLSGSALNSPWSASTVWATCCFILRPTAGFPQYIHFRSRSSGVGVSESILNPCYTV